MMRRIVVLGAGYGGLVAARMLGQLLPVQLPPASPPYEVVLLDRSEAHELKPKLPEAIGEWIDCTVHVPIREALADLPVRFVQAEVQGLNPETREVVTDAGPLAYWRLVWALGARPNFQPNGQQLPGLSPELAIAPYDGRQACRLRRQIGAYLAQAATLPPIERQSLLTVVIGGGGFVGTEIAGQLADRLARLARQYQIPVTEIRLILAEPRATLLAGFDERLGQAAQQTLRAKGVDVRLGVGLAEIHPDHVVLSDGARIETRTVVWAGGVRGLPLAKACGFTTDERDRIWVNACLQTLDWPDVYAIGDGARSDYLERLPALVGSGQAAAGQGRAVAHAILAETRGEVPRPYRLPGGGVVALLGYEQAAAHVGPWAPLRPIAPWLKQLAVLKHLRALGGVRLARRHWDSTVLPLVAPDRVDRYRLAGDGPPAAWGSEQ